MILVKRKKVIVISLLLIFIVILISIACFFETKTFLYPRLYQDIVSKYSAEYNVPEQIIFATIKNESNFNPNAVSYAGAIGLMQLMPETFEWIISDMLGETIIGKNAFDPDTNIKCGTYMLSWLYKKFEDWTLVFAAYNAGIGNVQKWLSNNTYSSNGKLTNIPFPETNKYVEKQINTTKIYDKLYYK